MGCAPSAEAGNNQVIPGGDWTSEPGNNLTHETTKVKKSLANGHTQQANESNNNQSQKGDKSVAFEIEFEKPKTYDSLISKHPPQRLKKLEPLSDAPKVTAEQLEEKIRLAEENRERELEKKKEVSRRSQKLRAEIQRAREVERASEQQRELDQKLHAADLARQQKVRELDEKKRVREERARKAREKAKRMKQEGGEELDYEIEKDDAFNADEDSWLEDDKTRDRDNTSDYHTDIDRFNSGQGDRIYSGRESPAKMSRTTSDKPQRIFSSSTTDSFDYAYERTRKTQPYDRTVQETDDFFDT